MRVLLTSRDQGKVLATAIIDNELPDGDFRGLGDLGFAQILAWHETNPTKFHEKTTNHMTYLDGSLIQLTQ